MPSLFARRKLESKFARAPKQSFRSLSFPYSECSLAPTKPDELPRPPLVDALRRAAQSGTPLHESALHGPESAYTAFPSSPGTAHLQLRDDARYSPFSFTILTAKSFSSPRIRG